MAFVTDPQEFSNCNQRDLTFELVKSYQLMQSMRFDFQTRQTFLALALRAEYSPVLEW